MAGEKSWHPSSLAAQALGRVEPLTHAVVPPVHVSTTFVRDPDNQYRTGFGYGRCDNATARQAEAVIAALEGGSEAFLFASGIAASTTAVLSLPPGSHVVASRVMYWAFRKWLSTEAPNFGFEVSLVDTTDLAAVREAMRETTRLVFVETPANPTWDVADIAALAEIAHKAGAKLLVDSTVATPVFTRPLSLGADMVMHSASKYLNGHSDVIAGVLIPSRADSDWWKRIKTLRTLHGCVLGGFEAWLLMRGLRTLDVRVRAQAKSAAELALRLESHPHVSRVYYPGLASHPGHDIAARQMVGGFGGMLSICVTAGEAAAIATAASVELWKRATSLGGVESLVEHRSSVEGPASPCPTNLLRLSVGLEHVDDLFADLDQALRKAAAA